MKYFKYRCTGCGRMKESIFIDPRRPFATYTCTFCFTETRRDQNGVEVMEEKVTERDNLDKTLDVVLDLNNACYLAGGRPPNLNMSLRDFIKQYGHNGVTFTHKKWS